MPIYMKMAGIEGSSTDKAHDKWIECDMVSLSANRDMEIGAKSVQRARGTTNISDLTIARQLDKSSALIFKALLKGEVFDKVEIHLCQDLEGKGSEPYLKYELENVLVSSYSKSAVAQGGKPNESLSLNYTKLAFIYCDTDVKNKPGGKIEATYDPAAHEVK
ncbi:MAG: type VI secretion system tube protein Hcp [Pirellulales bacterium]